jgi:hypothetical protein
MPAPKGLSKDMINWIGSFGFGPQYQRSAKADLFELTGVDIMSGYMVDSIL